MSTEAFRHVTYAAGYEVTDEANDGNGHVVSYTSAHKVQMLLDRMFEETMADEQNPDGPTRTGGVWSGAEWRANVEGRASEAASRRCPLSARLAQNWPTYL